MEKMKSNKSSGSKHRQVKPDRKADPPSKVGLKGRKIPQRKASRLPTSSSCPSAYVPYKKDYDVNQFKELLSRIPKIPWEIPSKFVLDSDWLVASGEESEETTIQKLRETSVREAVYPRVSAIPLSPLTTDVGNHCYDDSQTRIIPITPIAETDSAATAPLFSSTELQQVLTTQPNYHLPPKLSINSISAPVEGDTLHAAVAAVTAMMRNINPGILIDTNLLIKLLSDPKTTLHRIHERSRAANNTSEPSESKIAVVAVPEPLPHSHVTKTGPVAAPIPGRLSISLPTSTLDLQSKQYVAVQSQLVTSEIVNVPVSVISPPIVAGTGIESHFTFKPGKRTDSQHNMLTNNKASTKQCYLTNAENVAPVIPWPPIHSIGERTYGTGLAPMPEMPRYPLSTSTFNSSNGYAWEHQDAMANIISPGLITEKQQLSQPRKPAGLFNNSLDPFGTSSDIGYFVSNPTPLLNSGLKDEHGVHDHGTVTYAVRRNHNAGNPSQMALVGKPSQPDKAAIKRMIRDYGLVNNSLKDDLSVAPLGCIPEPTQHPSSFGASPFPARTTVPPSKDLSYYQSLIKQHGDTHDKQPPHTWQRSEFISKPKTQELCLYFNTPKGCQNGSKCLFRHEVSDKKRRSGAISAAPDAKRMKPSRPR